MNSLLQRAWHLVNACSRFVVPAIILIFVLTSKFKVCFKVEPKFLHLSFLGRKPRLFTKSLVFPRTVISCLRGAQSLPGIPELLLRASLSGEQLRTWC